MGTLKKFSMFFLLVVLLASCMTEKKWAEGCAQRFPVKESTVYVSGEVKYDTAYLAPDTLVFTDTVTVDCDSVFASAGSLTRVVTKYVYQEKACPPAPVITVNRVDTFSVTKIDRSEAAAALTTATEQRQRADRLQDGRDTWRWISVVCFLVIGTAIFSKIKGFI